MQEKHLGSDQFVAMGPVQEAEKAPEINKLQTFESARTVRNIAPELYNLLYF
jgi:hypothetical protein